MTFMDYFFPHDNNGRSSRDSFILFEPPRGCSVYHHSKIDVLTCLQVLGGFYELQIFLFLCVAVVYVKCIKGESIYQLQKLFRDAMKAVTSSTVLSFKQFGRFVKLLLDEHCPKLAKCGP